MMAGDAPSSKGGMRSLYANLLGDSTTSTPGTISSAPVTYKQAETSTPEQDEAAKKQQSLAASLPFQPTKRPQLQAQKAKAKAIAAKFSQPPNAIKPVTEATTTSEREMAEAPLAAQPLAPKTTLADWTADDDVNDYYAGEKRQRGGRKKRKKNKAAEEIPQNWDDIYDPSRPNNYQEYQDSDEKIREIRDWKDRLYAHRMRRRDPKDYDSDEEERRPRNNQFAPPPMSFAPPKAFDEDGHQSPPPTPPADVPDDATGEDAYTRRMRMSHPQAVAPPSPSSAHEPPPPPPPPGQISRAPVRYNLPPAPTDIPATETELEAALADASPEATSNPTTPSGADPEAPRSRRPGQAGFAERLMSKYGWTKGTGLGATGTGIVNPLYAKVDKRKKKSDAEGGGFATPAGHGKILGGHKDAKGREDDEGRFGKMSEVIKLRGMLKGLDLDEELSRDGDGSGGLMQEIGEECSDKYGTVERVYIHRHDVDEDGPLVFVKFTSQLSALRAVNALEGRIFGGNEIGARFWDRDKFDEGVYE